MDSRNYPAQGRLALEALCCPIDVVIAHDAQDSGRRKMSKMTVDIDYSTDGEEATFTANTPAGEELLGAPKLQLPHDEALLLVADGRAKGLIILSAF